MRFVFLLLSFQLLGQFKTEEPIRYLALGDSYTIGESVSYDQRWPSQLYDTLGGLGLEQDTLVYLATTGWTTSSLKNAVSSIPTNIDFNLVSLLIGVNNQYQGKPFNIYKKEFPELVETALEFTGGQKEHLFVVSIPDYAYTSFGRGNVNISNQLDDYNQFAENYCDSLGITFYYITSISRQGLDKPELVAADGLHPSGLQYSLWVDLIMSDYEEELLTLIERNTLQSLTMEGTMNKLLSMNETVGEYQIINLKGVIVQESSGNRKIDISNIPRGIYFFRSRNMIKRFIK